MECGKLFDTVDDPYNENDDGYTPKGWARWTDEKYQLKLDHLAEVIAGIKPDILCLTEVENRRVLEDLSETLRKNHDYLLTEIIHREGDDVRGIDVAMMAKFKPVGTKWFSAISGQRDVLACDFSVDGAELTVLVNHWKSKLGQQAQSDYIRTRQAQSVRDFIDLKLNKNPASAILVTGDFNSDIDTAFLTETAGFLTSLDELKKESNTNRLYNLASVLTEKERATYYYAPSEKWNSLDSISVTRANTERESLGLPPIWPSDAPPYTNHITGCVECFNFTNSTDYFDYIFDRPNLGTEKHNPMVAGVDFSKLAGAGVAAYTGPGPLRAENNMWTIAKNITDRTDDIVPFLITRNLDAEFLVSAVAGEPSAEKIPLGQTWDTPFSNKGAVIIPKGGGLFTLRAKYATPMMIYNRPSFDANANSKYPLKYLTPTREVIPFGKQQ